MQRHLGEDSSKIVQRVKIVKNINLTFRSITLQITYKLQMEKGTFAMEKYGGNTLTKCSNFTSPIMKYIHSLCPCYDELRTQVNKKNENLTKIKIKNLT